MKRKTGMLRGEETSLKNLGPVSRGWLSEVGIENLADLDAFGALEAFRLVRAETERASLNLLWALVGAELELDHRELPKELKEELLCRLSHKKKK